MAEPSYSPGARLRKIERTLDNPERPLKKIGALMTAESQEAFSEQEFDEKQWPGRRVPNVFGILADFAAGKKSPPQRRFESRPALRDTGRLAASISWSIVASDTVEVGTNLAYAGVQHAGGDVESVEITEKIQDALWAWLRKKKNQEWRSKLGWLLNKKFRGTKLKARVPARPFVGLTRQGRKDIEEAIGVTIVGTS